MSAEPVGLSLVMKASPPPPFVVWKAFVTGKSLMYVLPVTYALPAASTAMLLPRSLSMGSPVLPPRYVRYERLVPEASSLATKASLEPRRIVWKAPGGGGGAPPKYSALPPTEMAPAPSQA